MRVHWAGVQGGGAERPQQQIALSGRELGTGLIDGVLMEMDTSSRSQLRTGLRPADVFVELELEGGRSHPVASLEV
jgi:hypothetical protein